MRLLAPGDTRYLSLFAVLSTEDGGVLLAYKPTLSASRLVKFDSAGLIDSTFGVEGQITFPGTTLEDLVLRPDGRILAVGIDGYTYPSGDGALLAQILPDGSPDLSFGEAGRLVLPYPNEGIQVAGVALGSGGEAFIGGAIRVEESGRSAAILRVLPDGTLDSSFGTEGVAWTDVIPASSGSYGFESTSRPYVRPDGGVGMFVGEPYNDSPLRLIGYDADGTPTLSNGPEGVSILFDASESFGVYALDSAGDGAVFLVGSRVVDGVSAAFIAHVIDKGQPTGTTDRPLPAAMALAVAPNPTAAAARVTLSLDAPGAATVRVVDALGRTVATLADRALPAGTTTLSVDASRLAPGVYAVIAETGTGRTVARFSVVR